MESLKCTFIDKNGSVTKEFRYPVEPNTSLELLTAISDAQKETNAYLTECIVAASAVTLNMGQGQEPQGMDTIELEEDLEEEEEEDTLIICNANGNSACKIPKLS